MINLSEKSDDKVYRIYLDAQAIADLIRNSLPILSLVNFVSN
ncbi:MAG: hypothetical protein ACFB16_05275 [Phormidesmis sp.]